MCAEQMVFLMSVIQHFSDVFNRKCTIRSVRAKSVADARSQSSTAYSAKERGIILKEVHPLSCLCVFLVLAFVSVFVSVFVSIILKEVRPLICLCVFLLLAFVSVFVSIFVSTMLNK